VQVCWVARLAIPPGLWSNISFAVLALAELAVPAWAEFGGSATSWHPGHINERYGLFTLIVLGEAVAAASTAVQSALSDRGLSAPLLVLASGGLLLIFGMWWSYFKHEVTANLRRSLVATFLWAYGHYGIFAAVAALGAGLEVAADTLGHDDHVGSLAAGFMVAVPVAVFLLLGGWLHGWMSQRPGVRLEPLVLGTVLVLAAAFLAAASLPVAVLVMGLVVALVLAVNLWSMRRALG
jgi:low temperature requirement protein LtrA